MTVPGGATQELVAQLQSTIRTLKTAVRDAPAGALTPSTAFLLGRLVATGGARCGALAEDVGVDASVISRQLGDLIRLGLAERRPDAVDGRAWVAAATPAGRAELQRFYDDHLAVVREALADWPPEQASLLTGLLRRLEGDVSRASDTIHQRKALA